MMQYVPGWLARLFINRSAPAIALQRRIYEQWMSSAGVPATVSLEETQIEGMTAQWVIPSDSSSDRVVLFLHGGGFTLGSMHSHAPYLARLCVAAHARGLLINYRRAPRYPFPAALHDAVSVFRWLFGRHLNPSNLVLAGDGAGANLVLSTLLTLRKEGHSLPAAALLISPWVDLVDVDRRLRFTDARQRAWEEISLDLFARCYAADFDRADPLISPVNANLEGLPPLLIQGGEHEALAGDAEKLAQQAKACEVEVYLDRYPSDRHSLPLLVTRDAGADILLQRAARFLNTHFMTP